ncbi:MAG TPA: hypothetical protein VGX92_17205 [Pyrinomonadaceae bacterium]|jgi:hypothetical protein|nr:hypothetical protein [Pyrinomonadaceae bacterium]
MKIAFDKIAVSLLLSLCVILQAERVGAQQSAEAPLTNASVIKLVRAGFREKTLIAIIHSRPVRFDLAPDKLIELKKSGVTERVILTMLARDGENALGADEGWSDDPFFGEGEGASRSRRNGTAGGDSSSSSGGSTGIFGSGSGSSSRTRGRGLSGANQDNTQTNGSATVRIIRPPAEAGGVPPTLERTPTLTNDRVVELVEAGFSEGTIIRRIEGSPADFDLSPAKLAELRRRRVGEPIINAMRAAMGDEQTSNAAGSTSSPER